MLETRAGSLVVCSYGILLMSILTGGIGRSMCSCREDKELRNAFRDEWDVRACRVPYMFVPGARVY